MVAGSGSSLVWLVNNSERNPGNYLKKNVSAGECSLHTIGSDTTGSHGDISLSGLFIYGRMGRQIFKNVVKDKPDMQSHTWGPASDSLFLRPVFALQSAALKNLHARYASIPQSHNPQKTHCPPPHLSFPKPFPLSPSQAQVTSKNER